MPVTYINGNTFTVDFFLWKRDITSYFRHAFFVFSPGIVFRTRMVRFVHSLLFTLIVTGSVLIVSRLVGLQNQALLALYVPFLLIIIIFTQYRRVYHRKSHMLGKQLVFCLEVDRMIFRHSGTQDLTILHPADIVALKNRGDMVIITTRDEEYLLPTRALSSGQIESLKAFHG